MIEAAHGHLSRNTHPLACLRRLNFGWWLILFCTLTTDSFAATSDPPVLPSEPWRYRSGLRNSRDRHQLNAKQLAAILESLRAKTGFLDLHFDAQGFLTLGDRRRIEGGSVSARALLIAALEGDRAIVLENHSRSPHVIFARTSSPTIYESRLAGTRMEAQPVEIDFSDFAQLRGPKEVVAAFDLGFVVLHELGHCALNLRDAENSPDEVGECESYINRIRRELGLPERQHYAARVQQAVTIPGQMTKRAELTFVRPVDKEGRARPEPLYLSWEFDKVGVSNTFKSVPASKDRVTSMAGQQ
jgi:hypothetical protein